MAQVIIGRWICTFDRAGYLAAAHISQGKNSWNQPVLHNCSGLGEQVDSIKAALPAQ
jgi:hypothetical protein